MARAACVLAFLSMCVFTVQSSSEEACSSGNCDAGNTGGLGLLQSRSASARDLKKVQVDTEVEEVKEAPAHLDNNALLDKVAKHLDKHDHEHADNFKGAEDRNAVYPQQGTYRLLANGDQFMIYYDGEDVLLVTTLGWNVDAKYTISDITDTSFSISGNYGNGAATYTPTSITFANGQTATMLYAHSPAPTPAPGVASTLGATPDQYYIDDGCHKEKTTPDDFPGIYANATEKMAGIRCCSLDGKTCKTKGSCQGRDAKKTYERASFICSTLGFRLCSREELLTDICCGTGGNCDNHYVWTQTKLVQAEVPPGDSHEDGEDEDDEDGDDEDGDDEDEDGEDEDDDEPSMLENSHEDGEHEDDEDGDDDHLEPASLGQLEQHEDDRQ